MSEPNLMVSLDKPSDSGKTVKQSEPSLTESSNLPPSLNDSNQISIQDLTSRQSEHTQNVENNKHNEHSESPENSERTQHSESIEPTDAFDHQSSLSASTTSPSLKAKKQIKPKSLNSLFLKVQASSSSNSSQTPNFGTQQKSQSRSESPSVSKPSPVGNYASLENAKGARSQITSISTATGAFKLATMTRDSSPFQKSLTSSTTGSKNSSPRAEVATVWRRTEEKQQQQNQNQQQSAFVGSLDSPATKKTAAHKNVSFDPNVKESSVARETSVTTSNNSNNNDGNDDISEEELLRQGIHLARRLSADGPRREFNWDDEDDDIPWSEMAKTPVFSNDMSSSANSAATTNNTSTTNNPSTSITTSSSDHNSHSGESISSPSNRFTKSPTVPVSLMSSSRKNSTTTKPSGLSSTSSSSTTTTPHTWKIPPPVHNIVPISKQIQELNDKKQQHQQHAQQQHQQQHAHHNSMYPNSSHHNFDSNRSNMMGWHNRGGSHDGYRHNNEVDSRYKYSDYEKRYHSEQSAPMKPELFNEHNGQIEAYHRTRNNSHGGSGSHNSRIGGPGASGPVSGGPGFVDNTMPSQNIHGNSAPPTTSSSSFSTHRAAGNNLEMYKRNHSVFLNQPHNDGAQNYVPHHHQQQQHGNHHSNQHLVGENGPEFTGHRRGSQNPSFSKSTSNTAASSEEYSENSGERPKSLLEVQEELMRISRENALKRKEEEARLEREKSEATKKKNEERLAKLQAAKKAEEDEESQAQEKLELQKLPVDDGHQTQLGSSAETHLEKHHHHQYTKHNDSNDDGKRNAINKLNGPQPAFIPNKIRRGSNFNNEENTAIRAVNSVIGDDNGEQRQNKPKLWGSGGPVRNSQSYTQLSGTSTQNHNHQNHHDNTSNTTVRPASSNISGGRGNHSHSNSNHEGIWGTGHGHLPPPSNETDFWKPFSSGIQNNTVYSSSAPLAQQRHQQPPSSAPASADSHRQDFSQQSFPTSASSTNHPISSWGPINTAQRSVSTTEASATAGGNSANSHSPTKGPYAQQTYAAQADSHGSWTDSHQSQRSVSMPNSPMSSIHTGARHQQPPHHTVSENNVAANASKLIGVRPSMHDQPTSMSRGISRFFPAGGADDKEHNSQLSPIESMAVISSANFSTSNPTSSSPTLASSPVHRSPLLSASKGSYENFQSSRLSNLPAHLNRSIQASNIPPHRPIHHQNNIAAPISAPHSGIVSNDGNGYMSNLVFPGQGMPTNFVGNIVLPPSVNSHDSAVGGSTGVSAYSPNITDSLLFGESSHVPISPRINLPPSRTHKANDPSQQPLGQTHHRNLSQGNNASQTHKAHSQQFKSSAPSINSIQELQTTIAEKLGPKKMAFVLQNENHNTRNIAANNNSHNNSVNYHNYGNVSKDLPIPVSPIVLSENIPPFNSSDRNKVQSIEKIFAPQALDQESVYTYIDTKNNTRALPPNQSVQQSIQHSAQHSVQQPVSKSVEEFTPVEHVQPAEPVVRKPQSFADAVALSLEADKRKQAARAPKKPQSGSATSPISYPASNSSSNLASFSTVQSHVLQASNDHGKSSIITVEESKRAKAFDQAFLNTAKKLVTQSPLWKLEQDLAGTVLLNKDGSKNIDNNTKISSSEIPIAMPYYTSSKYNPDIKKNVHYNNCNDIPQDWDTGLVVPHDDFICNLFYWLSSQPVAFNREFKPRTTSRVALLIPRNAEKILTLYRIGNLESLTSAPGNGMSLFEMVEKAKNNGSVATASATNSNSTSSPATATTGSTNSGKAALVGSGKENDKSNSKRDSKSSKTSLAAATAGSSKTEINNSESSSNTGNNVLNAPSATNTTNTTDRNSKGVRKNSGHSKSTSSSSFLSSSTVKPSHGKPTSNHHNQHHRHTSSMNLNKSNANNTTNNSSSNHNNNNSSHEGGGTSSGKPRKGHSVTHSTSNPVTSTASA